VPFNQILKKAIFDKSNLLVSSVYNTSKSFASTITSVKTPSAGQIQRFFETR